MDISVVIPVRDEAENIPELVMLAALHLLFINRVRLARVFAAGQREKDLERFTAIKHELESPGEREH